MSGNVSAKAGNVGQAWEWQRLEQKLGGQDAPVENRTLPGKRDAPSSDEQFWRTRPSSRHRIILLNFGPTTKAKSRSGSRDKTDPGRFGIAAAAGAIRDRLPLKWRMRALLAEQQRDRERRLDPRNARHAGAEIMDRVEFDSSLYRLNAEVHIDYHRADPSRFEVYARVPAGSHKRYTYVLRDAQPSRLVMEYMRKRRTRADRELSDRLKKLAILAKDPAQREDCLKRMETIVLLDAPFDRTSKKRTAKWLNFGFKR